MTDQPFTPSMPMPPTHGTIPVILSPEVIHGPLKIGPSGAQVEQARQAEVNLARARLLAHNGVITAATPQDRADGVPWLLLAVLALATAYAVGQRNAEVRMGAMLEPLEYRVATAEAWNVNLRNRLAAISGVVEQKIDAYAMVEAHKLMEEQQP